MSSVPLLECTWRALRTPSRVLLHPCIDPWRSPELTRTLTIALTCEARQHVNSDMLAQSHAHISGNMDLLAQNNAVTQTQLAQTTVMAQNQALTFT